VPRARGRARDAACAPPVKDHGGSPAANGRTAREEGDGGLAVRNERWSSATAFALARNVLRPTFELSGRQRQAARPGLAKMYRVPPDRAWWPAVGAPLERGVRRCSRLRERREQVPSFRCSNRAPERKTFCIGLEDEQVALVDALRAERLQPSSQELPAQAAPSEFFGGDEMMNEAAPPVMAAEDGANERFTFVCDEARSGIPRQVLLDLSLLIRLAQTDA